MPDHLYNWAPLVEQKIEAARSVVEVAYDQCNAAREWGTEDSLDDVADELSVALGSLETAARMAHAATNGDE